MSSKELNEKFEIMTSSVGGQRDKPFTSYNRGSRWRSKSR